jgi:HEPN domain-containing protein
MNALVQEWIDKAEGDFATANREMHAKADPNFDAVCFHAQQGIEKLMKAALIQKGAPAPRTHDLVYLNTLLTAVYPFWTAPVGDLRLLSRSGVAFRYPGESADSADAADALAIAAMMRPLLLALLT